MKFVQVREINASLKEEAEKKVIVDNYPLKGIILRYMITMITIPDLMFFHVPTMNTKHYKTGVINDPLGQTHNLACSEHCFHLKFV